MFSIKVCNDYCVFTEYTYVLEMSSSGGRETSLEIVTIILEEIMDI